MAVSYIVITYTGIIVVILVWQPLLLNLIQSCSSVEQGFDANQFEVRTVNGQIIEDLAPVVFIRCPKSCCFGFLKPMLCKSCVDQVFESTKLAPITFVDNPVGRL